MHLWPAGKRWRAEPRIAGSLIQFRHGYAIERHALGGTHTSRSYRICGSQCDAHLREGLQYLQGQVCRSLQTMHGNAAEGTI
jgi:hypothetical protein